MRYPAAEKLEIIRTVEESSRACQVICATEWLLLNRRPPVSDDHGELIEGPFPVQHRHGPFLGNPLHAPIPHLQHNFVGGERASLLQDCA